MSLLTLFCALTARRARVVLVLLAADLAFQTAVEAQQYNPNQAVGGVAIDAGGILRNAQKADLAKARAQLEAVPQDMNESGLRKISLRRLEGAIQECLAQNKPIPDAIHCLAGLQRIEYVLVYPDQKDIVLVGPGEGWKLDARGNVVGVKSGRPVMLLDDLLVALRATGGATRTVLSCSIDPTQEGLQRVRAHASKLRPGVDPQTAAVGIEEQLGPQRISVTGVPATSHFARVMVAADYRMKRVSMDLEPAPVSGLPSFLEMMKGTGSGMSNMLPRWWLEPAFEPLVRDAEGLTWQLRGASVKAMAENDFLDAHGVKHQTGKADVVSQRWADLMTQKYDELSLADPIFGQLRNCMDLAVVAALFAKENLAEKAGHKFALLAGTDGMATAKFEAPKQVASNASLVKKGKKTMIAAGGVQINPWTVVEKAETSAKIGEVRGKSSAQDATAWWWN